MPKNDYIALSHAVQGRGHEKNNIPCQDATHTLQNDTAHIITLADGAGSARFSHFGAEATVKKMADFLSKNFDRFYNVKKEEFTSIKKEIITTLCENLQSLAAKKTKEWQKDKDFKAEIQHIVKSAYTNIQQCSKTFKDAQATQNLSKLLDFYRSLESDVSQDSEKIEKNLESCKQILDDIMTIGKKHKIRKYDEQLQKEIHTVEIPKSIISKKEHKNWIQKKVSIIIIEPFKYVVSYVASLFPQSDSTQSTTPQSQPTESKIEKNLMIALERFIKDRQQFVALTFHSMPYEHYDTKTELYKSYKDNKQLLQYSEKFLSFLEEFKKKTEQLTSGYKDLYKKREESVRDYSSHVNKALYLDELKQQNLKLYKNVREKFNECATIYHEFEKRAKQYKQEFENALSKEMKKFDEIKTKIKEKGRNVESALQSLQKAIQDFKKQIDTMPMSSPMTTNPLTQYVLLKDESFGDSEAIAQGDLQKVESALQSYNQNIKNYNACLQECKAFYTQTQKSFYTKTLDSKESKFLIWKEQSALLPLHLTLTQDLVEYAKEIENSICYVKDLASTLLFAAIQDSKFIVGHLGDGVIGALKSKGKQENIKEYRNDKNTKSHNNAKKNSVSSKDSQTQSHNASYSDNTKQTISNPESVSQKSQDSLSPSTSSADSPSTSKEAVKSNGAYKIESDNMAQTTKKPKFSTEISKESSTKESFDTKTLSQNTQIESTQTTSKDKEQNIKENEKDSIKHQKHQESQEIDSEIIVVSHPDNGKYSNATIFVTTKNADAHLRLIKGEMCDSNREIYGFVLMSDGSGESFYQSREKRLMPILGKLLHEARHNKESAQRSMEEIMEKKVKEKTTDDCSLNLIVKRLPSDDKQEINDNKNVNSTISKTDSQMK